MEQDEMIVHQKREMIIGEQSETTTPPFRHPSKGGEC